MLYYTNDRRVRCTPIVTWRLATVSAVVLLSVSNVQKKSSFNMTALGFLNNYRTDFSFGVARGGFVTCKICCTSFSF